MGTKKLILFGSAIIFLLSCSYFLYYKNISSSQSGVTMDRITIGNIGEYSIFNIIAQEKGYFRENGLHATVQEYPAGPPAVEALLAGKVDFAVAADFVGVRNIFTNQNLRIVTQASKHKVFHILARKDKGIFSPSDLKGKTIGVTRKGAGEFYLGRFLLFNNLKLNDVTIRDLDPTQLISQLENGTIDAIVIFDPHAYRLKNNLGNIIISWSAQQEQNIFALVYSTNTYLTTHPDVTIKYLRALLQAENFVNEFPEEAQAIIAKKLHYDKAYMQYMWSQFTFEQGLDQELLLTMEDEARWTLENNLTDQKQPPNYLNYIYFDALKEVKPESITIIH